MDKDTSGPIQVLESFIACIDGKHAPLGPNVCVETDGDTESFFGEFKEYYDKAGGSLVVAGEGVVISWPGLKALIEEAKKAIKEVAPIVGFREVLLKLTGEYGLWGEHPEHTRSEWGVEAHRGDTNLGYWEWVVHQIDAART